MFLHPSVTSQIIDNSSSYVVSEGTTQLLAVITADKGKDNEITRVTSTSEFIFKFGEPNMKKHGQAAYNVVNWLDQKGGAYIVRVLPENAGYSHAFLNIQTKEGTKKVLNSENQLVNYPDVAVRSTISYTTTNNVSEDSLVHELTDTTIKNKTIDGYENHLLLGVYPKGRGAYYNNLGFKLSLTNAYDETYSFRIYNFEVTQVAENGSVQVVEGPFVVSFDPDAVSKGNESLFIKSVINNNSDYLNVMFNEDEYDRLGSIINPNVAPEKLDFLTGITRTVDDAPETYFDEALNLDVDLQIRTHQYNANGEYTGKSNYNMIESNIILTDNTNRTNEYNDGVLYFENSKVALSAFKKNKFIELLDDVFSFKDTDGSDDGSMTDLKTGALAVAYDELKSAMTEYNTAKDTYIASKSNDNFVLLQNAMKTVLAKIKEVNKNIKLTISYAECMNETTILGTEIRTKLKIIVDALDALEIITLGVSNKQTLLTNESVKLASLTGKETEAKLEIIYSVLNAYDEVIKYTKELPSTDVLGSSTEEEATLTAYNKCLTLYTDATDPYLIEGEQDAIVVDLVANVTSTLEKIQTFIKIVSAENSINSIADANTKIVTLKADVVTLVTNAITRVNEATTVEIKNELILNIKKIIDFYEDRIAALKENSYEIKLQNYALPIQLANGHSGTLENATAKEKEKIISNLIISVFNGTIDSSIVDANMCPFDIVLDAGYDTSVKNAIINFVTEVRDDIMALLDTEYPNSPVDSLNYKSTFVTYGGFNVAIFTQYFTVADTRYTGKDIDVTPTYFLASKIPANDITNGVHSTFVGPRRGIINASDFKNLSFNPTDTWKEQFYKNKINYVERDNRRTKFATQLTFQRQNTALSQISNVRALLKIRKEVSAIAEEYIQERMTDDTLTLLDQEINEYLVQWTDNGCCKEITGRVYASDYEKSQNTLNVQIELVFTDIIERININLLVSR